MPLNVTNPFGSSISVTLLNEAAAQSFSVSDGGSLSVQLVYEGVDFVAYLLSGGTDRYLTSSGKIYKVKG